MVVPHHCKGAPAEAPRRCDFQEVGRNEGLNLVEWQGMHGWHDIAWHGMGTSVGIGYVGVTWHGMAWRGRGKTWHGTAMAYPFS